ncbi:DUF115 domain-containing protein [Entomospira nematocerorum]|uniref:Motility associated factor glycosyltransferase family protein n=1 Tax=Entomospira nematocerorum TaxID=2719987 RepID=A0A968GFL2_9SPIO|nr:6-hydroxymethylpterin diphosphokinase MptE-like protein [Entomospira nematocera]NIZ47338.1 motility associated factor glycosyltransferase family protein [Entomospira nematocera]WDI34120.1 DUF115 domain-containing protein [Entomospira nematocera]
MHKQISKRFPFLQEKSPHYDHSLRVERSRNGEPTLFHNATALHSRYDPIREAERDIMHIPPDTDTILIAGFGLGYVTEAVIKAYPSMHIIIIEPNPSYFTLAEEYRNLDIITNHLRLTICYTQQTDVLIQQLFAWQSENPYWIELRPRTQLDPSFFDSFRTIFRQYQQRIQTNRLTLAQYSWLWWRNGIKNKEEWITMKPVSQLFHSCKDMPILVIAAGPSLSHHINDIQYLKERMLIICVETALRILLQHSIHPDIVVSIDSQYWNARHVDNLNLENIIYVLEGSVHPMLIRNIPQSMRYLMDPLTPIFQPLQAILPPLGSLRSGGSVSITAWDLALQMQPSSIWCLGFDFAYPHAATHAKGALFEEWLVASATRLNPVTMQQHHLIHQKGISIPNNYGTMIRSDTRMQLYQQWIEEALIREKVPSYNLSSLGAAIKGMPYKSIAEALELSIIRSNIDNIVQHMKQMPMPKTHFPSLISQFHMIKAEMEQSIVTIKNMLSHSDVHVFQQSIASSFTQFSILPYIRQWINPLKYSLDDVTFLEEKERLLIKLQALSTFLP